MTNITSESNSISNNFFVQFVTQCEKFILPCLLLIGTTCNCLTFLVMRRGRMRYSSSCFYMAALALADTGVLWIGCLNRWLELIDKQRPILACNACCKFGTFAFFLFADCSVWITVAMTVERYIAVSQPLRASQICTIKRARYILLLLIFIFIFVNSHFLWTFYLSEVHSHCIPANDQLKFLKYFTWFDSFKYSFCPFTLLITLNILIIRSLLTARNTNRFLDQQTKIFNRQSSSVSSTSVSMNLTGNLLVNQPKINYAQQTPTKILAYRKVNRRLTTMLLTVSFAFCICSMPIAIMQLIDVIYSDVEQRSYRMNLSITIGKMISEVSQYVNHSSNFFLYAFTGRIFRHELRRLFHCYRYRLSNSSKRAHGLHHSKNPTEGLHEQFYSHGKSYTKVLIAPKHLLSLPTKNTYRHSLSSTYSFSQTPFTRQPEQSDTANFNRKTQLSLNSLISRVQIDPKTPLLHSATVHQTIKPYGLTDTILPSSL